MSGTIITVAPTGAEASKETHGVLPTSPAEIANAALACRNAGASIVHVHVRDQDSRPTLDLTRVKETIGALRDATDIIVQVSTGGDVSDDEDERLGVLDSDPDSASLTCGTVNFGDSIFRNPWPFMVELYRNMRNRHIVPEFELFELGHIANMKRLLDKEGPPYGGHVHVNLVMGVPGGMDGTPANLLAAVQQLPGDATFSATGVGRSTFP